MRENVELTGIVLSSMPVKDYDKRLVILTRERGKITAFANGARKPNSPYRGISEPFNFGTFTLREGYDAYGLQGGEIKEYFTDVKNDIEGICYGTYFCEVLEYLCVEGIGDANILNLLYLSLKALSNKNIANRLIRRIFELKLLVYDGEALEAFSCVHCRKEAVKAFSLQWNGLLCAECATRVKGSRILQESTVYTLQYIISSSLDQLFTFQLSEEILEELEKVIGEYFAKHVPAKFNSLEILASLS